VLANAKWRTISGAPARKESSRLVLLRSACGLPTPPQRIRDKGQQHLPGDEAWLIGEHRMSGEKKYYLANLPTNTGLLQAFSPPVGALSSAFSFFRQ
jgi:SRSO17 transposase